MKGRETPGAYRKVGVALLTLCFVFVTTASCDMNLLYTGNAPVVMVTSTANNPETPTLLVETAVPTLTVQTESQPEPAGLPMVEPLWIFNQLDQTVVRINQADNTPAVAIQLSGSVTLLDRLEDVTHAEGAVWAAAGQNVVRLDPTTNQVVGLVVVPQGLAVRLKGGQGLVWVGVMEIAGPDSAPGSDYYPGGGLAWINPTTNQTEDYTVLDGPVLDMAVLPASVWLIVLDATQNQVKIVNMRTRLPATLDNPALRGYHFTAVAALGENVWLATSEQKALELDASTGKVIKEVGLEGQTTGEPVAVAGAFNAVWVATNNGDIVRVDPFEGIATARVETGDSLGRLYANEVAVWALSRDLTRVYRIDPQTNQVVAKILTGSQPDAESVLVQSTFTPAPQPTWQPCFDTFPSNLHVGMRAMVKPKPPIPNHVRDGATTEAHVLGNILPGGTMIILDGPVCQDTWIWWKVRAEADGLEGWTAEGDGNDYWVVPAG